MAAFAFQVEFSHLPTLGKILPNFNIWCDGNMDKLKKVEVTWLDATSFSNEWLDIEEIKKLDPDEYTTVAILIDQTDDTVILAQSHGKGRFYNIFEIPKGSVKSLKSL